MWSTTTGFIYVFVNIGKPFLDFLIFKIIRSFKDITWYISGFFSNRLIIMTSKIIKCLSLLGKVSFV